MKEPIFFETSGLQYGFDAFGGISRIVSACSDLVNGMIPGPADGGIGEIVLRLYHGSTPEVYPLTGRDSDSSLSVCPEGLCFRRDCGKVKAEVCFLPGQEGWLWLVTLAGSCEAFDILYMQDIGLAEIPAQRTNELYTAQYLAHHPQNGPHGFTIASRQNLPQGGRHPTLWQGMLDGRVVSYATDGTQYFGGSYRVSLIPEARSRDLPGTVLQGESACVSLQTQRLPLDGRWTGTFFALYQADHAAVIAPEEIPDTACLKKLLPASEKVRLASEYASARRKPVRTLLSPEMTEEEVCLRFPERELEERDDKGNLLSFFGEDHLHVVLQRKELLCERPHGTILTTLFDPDCLPDNLLTSTAYMYGNFACQTVVGNTSLHKLNSVSRGRYDWLHFGGTRILIRLGDEWHRLGIPALFEMDFNSARWVYLLPDDELDVRVWMSAVASGMKLEARSACGRAYDFLLTMQTVMGDREFDQGFRLARKENGLVLRMGEDTFCRYPDLAYSITVDCPFELHRDELFWEDGQVRDETLLTFFISAKQSFSAEIHGDLYGAAHPAVRSFSEEKQAYHTGYTDFLRGFSLAIPQDRETARRVNHTAYWFLHNAMVHFCVPHGLEQTGGAAWGTRDICQGPMELILATGHYALAKAILVRVFENQNPDGDWPQWFMFDRYREIRAGESHGDIVFWPLKSLGDYLSRTGDLALLEEIIHPSGGGNGQPLMELVLRSVSLIGDRFIPQTDFLRYGNGDWDDTLQPANSELRSRMSSAWVQALAFQTLKLFCGDSMPELISRPCWAIAERLKKGFDRMAENGYIPGFCLTDETGGIRTLIDPQDGTTGIHYRLIPYTRAILSGLADEESADAYLRIVREHLLAPDGAHLLDRPTHYGGGNSRMFLRAEQAANIGREISLQYVHAHIRYTFALAKCGKAGEAWKALLTVAPPKIGASVPNAMVRQSNVYFTSSDADIPDRAAFEALYADVLRGLIPVKGGWRLYSSGPGIWLALLLDSILAVHTGKPVIPDRYDGLVLTYRPNGMEKKLVYHAATGAYHEEMPGNIDQTNE